MTENSSSWQCQCEPAKVLSAVWNLRLPSCSYLTAVGSSLQQQHDPELPLEASYSQRIPICIFLAEFVVTCPVIFAFWVHSEASPGIPSNETLHHWGSEAITREHFHQTLGADTISSHLPEKDLQVDIAKFGKNNGLFLSGLMQFFKKAELCCCFFATWTSWTKVLYLHRRNVTNRAVGAQSFKILWKEENKFSAEVR